MARFMRTQATYPFHLVAYRTIEIVAHAAIHLREVTAGTRFWLVGLVQHLLDNFLATERLKGGFQNSTKWKKNPTKWKKNSTRWKRSNKRLKGDMPETVGKNLRKTAYESKTKKKMIWQISHRTRLLKLSHDTMAFPQRCTVG